MIDKESLNKIENEIRGDKRAYLESCKNKYSEYLEAAEMLFPECYKMMSLLLKEKKDPYTLYISKALECKENKDNDEEKGYLKAAVKSGAYTPYAYERLAVIYSGEGDDIEAYNVCKKWFDLPYWKIPNMAVTSLEILNIMEKVESKIKKTGQWK